METIIAILHKLRDERRRDYKTTVARDEAMAEPAIGGIETKKFLH